MMEDLHGELQAVGVRDGKLILRGEDGVRDQVFEVPDHETYMRLVTAVETIPQVDHNA